MNRHSISLKGPWMARTVVLGEVRSMRLNVKTPADWNGWQDESPDSGEVILERKFNWLFPEAAPERIDLQVKSSAAPIGTLNGQSVAFEELDSVWSAEVTHLLKSSNQLALRFILDNNPAGTSILKSVELQGHG